MLNITEKACPSVGDCVLPHATEPLVLAPPVSHCIECDKRLVSYHNCSVRYFSRTGSKLVEKVTLRCLHCRVLYNYAQYGNKSEVSELIRVRTSPKF